jgi:hypothetical protein
MTTTAQDALDRLLIVKAATEGDVPDNPLAAVEAFGAVTGFLEAVLDDTRDKDCPRCQMVFALALNAATFGSLAPVLAYTTGPDSRFSDLAFTAFADTVELLIEMHHEEDLA